MYKSPPSVEHNRRYFEEYWEPNNIGAYHVPQKSKVLEQHEGEYFFKAVKLSVCFLSLCRFGVPICPAITGGRTISRTSLSSSRWRKRTTGSSWDEFKAAILDFSSASRLFSIMRMSPILTGNMCSSSACTRAKNLSKYWSWGEERNTSENACVCRL